MITIISTFVAATTYYAFKYNRYVAYINIANLCIIYTCVRIGLHVNYLTLSNSFLYSVLFFILLVFILIFIMLILEMTEKESYNSDSLTQLYNRRYMDYMDVSCFKNFPLTCIAIDIDFFKKINDTYGHDTGDVILKEVGSLIQQNIDSNDIPVRIGGEEIIIISFDKNMMDSISTANKLCDAVRDHVFYNNIKVTISVGVGHLDKFDGSRDTFNILRKKADIVLYKAKNNGRDKVWIDHKISLDPEQE